MLTYTSFTLTGICKAQKALSAVSEMVLHFLNNVEIEIQGPKAAWRFGSQVILFLFLAISLPGPSTLPEEPVGRVLEHLKRDKLQLLLASFGLWVQGVENRVIQRAEM